MKHGFWEWGWNINMIYRSGEERVDLNSISTYVWFRDKATFKVRSEQRVETIEFFNVLNIIGRAWSQDDSTNNAGGE